MPAVLILQKRNPFSLQSSGDDHQRAIRFGAVAAERREDLLHVVTIDDPGLPSERLKAPLVGLEIVSVDGFAALPQAVDVQDSHKIVQPIVPRQLHGLPLGSFGHLAVTQKNIGCIGQTIDVFGVQRHSHADGEPLPERSGGRFRISEGIGRMSSKGLSNWRMSWLPAR